MRGHGNARGVLHHAGLHSFDRPFTDICGGRTAKAVEGFFLIVTGVVKAVVVRLPELQKCVTNQMPIAIVNVTHQ
ncbi:hypothetical protein D3C87_1986550 [compost metagenome]